MKNMETKKQIRARQKQKRESLSCEQVQRLSEEICGKISWQPWFLQAETICFYYPLGKEVNLLALAKKALTVGKKVAFPRVEGKEMKFYGITSLEDFREGSFHVMEPVGGEPLTGQDALVFVPGLGFDSRGNRIGYGGGYYDRYFARYPQCVKIGVAYAVQLVEELKVEVHDISMDGVVTEEEIYGRSGVIADGRVHIKEL